MFGLGFGEILVILVIALLVFGPERLPDLARTLGKTMAELRRAMDDVRSEFRGPVHDFERSLRTETSHENHSGEHRLSPPEPARLSEPQQAPAASVVSLEQKPDEASPPAETSNKP